MSASVSEREVLRALVPELEAEGYEVFLDPRAPLAPAFLEGVMPDAIAIRGDKKLLIEVVGRSGPNGGSLERLQRLLKNQPGWELRVVVVSPTTVPMSISVQSAEAIARQTEQVRQLVDAGFSSAALLLGWAAFEAAARALMTEAFQKPQTPGRLVEVLAEDGILTPTEADRLRGLAKARNALIHGGLDVSVTDADLRAFLTIISTLANAIETGRAVS